MQCYYGLSNSWLRQGIDTCAPEQTWCYNYTCKNGKIGIQMELYSQGKMKYFLQSLEFPLVADARSQWRRKSSSRKNPNLVTIVCALYRWNRPKDLTPYSVIPTSATRLGTTKLPVRLIIFPKKNISKNNFRRTLGPIGRRSLHAAGYAHFEDVLNLEEMMVKRRQNIF